MQVRKQFPFAAFEPAWQRHWLERSTFRAANPGEPGSEKPKYYALDMFPYPSGAGLHVGHPEGWIATDIVSRYKRMKGFNVLHPMGWDAFGLPAEQYAVQTGTHPRETTEKNIATFRRQIQELGFSYDWSREINTTDPAYYKWTQWIFVQLYKKGLAYVSHAPVWYCPALGTVLANEEVLATDEGPRSERGNHPVERRPLRQWMLKITAYAERLLADLDQLDWPESLKEMQRNWIGRSEGAEVHFRICHPELVEEPALSLPKGSVQSSDIITVFTTRPDTLFGATYMVLSPEHPLVDKITTSDQREAVRKYKAEVANKSDLERTDLAKDKTGVFTGADAINPVNGEKIPIWIADYVLMGYGTGAIMAVPAHDERDHEFASIYGLPIIEVVRPPLDSSNRVNQVQNNPKAEGIETAYSETITTSSKGEGRLVRQTSGGRDQYAHVVIQVIPVGRGKGITIENKAIRDSIPAEYIPACKKGIEEALLNGVINGSPVVDLEIHITGGSYHETDSNELAFKLAAIFAVQDAMKKAKPILLQPVQKTAFTDIGFAINSSFLDGLPTAEAKVKMIDWLEKEGKGARRVQYKLRDWLFSRQRYWGEPFPVVWNGNEHEVIPESELPLVLPELEDYKPTAEGLAPLAKAGDWLRLPDGRVRETNTMPQWAGSCWYYLRYCDPKNSEKMIDPAVEKYWMGSKGVDLYIGGAEHAVLHLLYARFWHKALFDLGVVSTPEPFHKLVNQGIILGEDNRKMSKSWGNVINPDDVVTEYGADSLRLFEMFLGPLEQMKPWSTTGIEGVYGFLGRVWRLAMEESQEGEWHFAPAKVTVAAPSAGLLRSLHAAILKVTDDIEKLKFNTAISALMVLVNDLTKEAARPRAVIEPLLLLLAPFAPHIAEELWKQLGHDESLAYEPWPVADPRYLVKTEMEIVFQVNGKVRGHVTVVPGATKDVVEAAARALPAFTEWTAGKTVKKVIFVPDKLINFVIG